MDVIVWNPETLGKTLLAVEDCAYRHRYDSDPPGGPARVETLLRCTHQARIAFDQRDPHALNEALYGAVWASHVLAKPPERVLAAA